MKGLSVRRSLFGGTVDPGPRPKRISTRLAEKSQEPRELVPRNGIHPQENRTNPPTRCQKLGCPTQVQRGTVRGSGSFQKRRGTTMENTAVPGSAGGSWALGTAPNWTKQKVPTKNCS